MFFTSSKQKLFNETSDEKSDFWESYLETKGTCMALLSSRRATSACPPTSSSSILRVIKRKQLKVITMKKVMGKKTKNMKSCCYKDLLIFSYYNVLLSLKLFILLVFFKFRRFKSVKLFCFDSSDSNVLKYVTTLLGYIIHQVQRF